MGAFSHSDNGAWSKRSGQMDAVAELSLDSIDSILAETNAQIPPPKEASRPHGKTSHEYETPLTSLLEDMPRKVPRQKDTTNWTRDRVLAKASKESSGSKKIERPKERPALGQNGSPTLVRRAGGTTNTSLTLHYSAQPSQKFFEPESHGITTKKPVPNTRTAEESNPIQKIIPDDWEDRREPWMKAKEKIKQKYPEGYQPMKKLSPDAIAGIRALHAQMPDHYTVPLLSREFEVSPESIIRILRTKWKPNAEEEADRQRRWHKRGQSVWKRWADMGKKPPKQWRLLGIGNGKPEWLLRRQSKYKPPPLPALITTARRKEEKQQLQDRGEIDSDLADKIF
ncbi:mitochondrion organization and biogenesis protein [Diplocarpon rosae]|nr:mitochondrion organization and biogenesis protein [Diplocarpon rosae]